MQSDKHNIQGSNLKNSVGSDQILKISPKDFLNFDCTYFPPQGHGLVCAVLRCLHLRHADVGPGRWLHRDPGEAHVDLLQEASQPPDSLHVAAGPDGGGGGGAGAGAGAAGAAGAATRTGTTAAAAAAAAGPLQHTRRLRRQINGYGGYCGSIKLRVPTLVLRHVSTIKLKSLTIKF